MQQTLDLLRAEIDDSDFKYAFSSRTADGLHFLYDDGVSTTGTISPIFRKYMDRIESNLIYWPNVDELRRAGFNSGEDYDRWTEKLEGQPYLLSFRMK
ncbi:MAG: hypothetical protein AABX14_03330 [Candidatus Aenigmatarchaeota archaeon]